MKHHHSLVKAFFQSKKLVFFSCCGLGETCLSLVQESRAPPSPTSKNSRKWAFVGVLHFNGLMGNRNPDFELQRIRKQSVLH